MAYLRTPNTITAGRALKQNPPPNPLNPSGILPLTFDAMIANTTTLGVVQIGANINVDANGVISVANTSITGSCCNVDVKLVTSNYTAKANDCYIGVKGSKGDDDDDSPTSIVITLPLGVTGKQYIIKNQKSGNIKVQGSGGQTLDSSTFKTLGNEASLIAIFDGTRWNLV
jgi:hypothetical protein